MERNNGTAYYFIDSGTRQNIIGTHWTDRQEPPQGNTYDDLMYVGRSKFRVGVCMEPPDLSDIPKVLRSKGDSKKVIRIKEFFTDEDLTIQ